MRKSVLLWLAWVTPAFAANPCVGVTGCNASSNQLVGAVSPIAEMVVAFAAAFATLFIIIGGFMMLMSAGNESNAEKGKKYVVYALIGFALTLMSQAIVKFVFSNAVLIDIADPNNAPFYFIAQIVKMMLALFNVIFVIIAVIAGFRMVIGGGQSSEFDASKKAIRWAIIGAIVVNLSYAMINATLNLGF